MTIYWKSVAALPALLGIDWNNADARRRETQPPSMPMLAPTGDLVDDYSFV